MVHKATKEQLVFANETKAALTALSFVRKKYKHLDYCVELHTDNMATLAFLKRGRTKAKWTLKRHLSFYNDLRSLDDQYNQYFHVKSEENPADFFTRFDEPQLY